MTNTEDPQGGDAEAKAPAAATEAAAETPEAAAPKESAAAPSAEGTAASAGAPAPKPGGTAAPPEGEDEAGGDRRRGARKGGRGVRVDGNLEKAIRQFRKRIERQGLFRELRKRRFYEKPSERRKRKQREAEKRRRKKSRND